MALTGWLIGGAALSIFVVGNLRFHDGDTPIEARFAPTRPGPHAVCVSCIDAQGRPGVSNPILIVVKK